MVFAAAADTFPLPLPDDWICSQVLSTLMAVFFSLLEGGLGSGLPGDLMVSASVVCLVVV